MHEVMCTVHGKVQGVAYRAYVEDVASGLNLTGYVMNNNDGSVTVCAQGTSDQLKEFIEHLYEGSSGAQVSDVGVSWQSAAKHYDDFTIKYQ